VAEDLACNSITWNHLVEFGEQLEAFQLVSAFEFEVSNRHQGDGGDLSEDAIPAEDVESRQLSRALFGPQSTVSSRVNALAARAASQGEDAQLKYTA
jgi:hypothetical protein